MRAPVQRRRFPFVRLILFSVGLIFIVYFVSIFNSAQFTHNINAILEKSAGKYSSATSFKPKFSENQKDSLKKVLAGFWSYTSGDTTKPYTFDDRIELKSNGIVWQVKQILLKVPSQNRIRIVHIHHAYLYPQGHPENDTTRLLCDMETIRQVFIVGDDTCYGESFSLDAWDIAGDGSFFTLAGRKYTKYTDPDLTRFFPPNMITLIDKFNIRQCKARMTVTDIVRNVVADDLQHCSIEERTWEDVTGIVKDYYIPLCLAHNDFSYSWNPLKGSFPLSLGLDITGKGDLSNALIQVGGEMKNKRLIENVITDEVLHWRFDVLKKGSGVFSCTVKDTLVFK